MYVIMIYYDIIVVYWYIVLIIMLSKIGKNKNMFIEVWYNI